MLEKEIEVRTDLFELEKTPLQLLVLFTDVLTVHSFLRTRGYGYGWRAHGCVSIGGRTHGGRRRTTTAHGKSNREFSFPMMEVRDKGRDRDSKFPSRQKAQIQTTQSQCHALQTNAPDLTILTPSAPHRNLSETFSFNPSFSLSNATTRRNIDPIMSNRCHRKQYPIDAVALNEATSDSASTPQPYFLKLPPF